MTDKTDIAALRKMTLVDLLSRCTDYDDMSLNMDASELVMLKQHIYLLEAERQQREAAEQKARNFENVAYGLAAEKEAAEKERDEISGSFAGMTEDYETKIAELRAKLASPVVLPAYVFVDDEFCKGHNFAVGRCAKIIMDAGFTVKGGE